MLWVGMLWCNGKFPTMKIIFVLLVNLKKKISIKKDLTGEERFSCRSLINLTSAIRRSNFI